MVLKQDRPRRRPSGLPAPGLVGNFEIVVDHDAIVEDGYAGVSELLIALPLGSIEEDIVPLPLPGFLQTFLSGAFVL